MYVAKAEGRIAGVIGCRDHTHINLLFVQKEFQRNGIAKALHENVLKQCKEAGMTRITVNSSPYAHEVYRKLGYVDDKPMQEVDGIRFYPMHRNL